MPISKFSLYNREQFCSFKSISSLQNDWAVQGTLADDKNTTFSWTNHSFRSCFQSKLIVWSFPLYFCDSLTKENLCRHGDSSMGQACVDRQIDRVPARLPSASGLGNLTSVDQVQEDEALLEFCDESLSANMATTLMKVAKAPPSSFLICPYAIKA